MSTRLDIRQTPAGTDGAAKPLLASDIRKAVAHGIEDALGDKKLREEIAWGVVRGHST